MAGLSHLNNREIFVQSSLEIISALDTPNWIKLSAQAFCLLCRNFQGSWAEFAAWSTVTRLGLLLLTRIHDGQKRLSKKPLFYKIVTWEISYFKLSSCTMLYLQPFSVCLSSSRHDYNRKDRTLQEGFCVIIFFFPSPYRWLGRYLIL